MQVSLTPILLVIELGFVFMLARRCGRLAPPQGNMGQVYVYLLKRFDPAPPAANHE